MKSRRWATILAVLIVGMLFAGSAHAVTALGNLGATQSGTACITGTALKADGFTTDGSGPYTLNAVTYTLLDVDGSVTVMLYTDAGGNPGSAIALVGVVALGSTSTVVDDVFTPGAAITLDNNTSYWLVIDPTSSTCMNPLAAGGQEPSGQFTYDGSRVSPDSGATWAFAAQSSILAVDVTAVGDGTPDAGAADTDSVPAGQPSFGDGRINVYDLGAPAVLYAQDYGNGSMGLTVYSPQGELLLVVTPAQIRSVAECPAQNTVIASSPEHGITLSRQAVSCNFLLTAPTAEAGKMYIITFFDLAVGTQYTSYETW
jgi:hypothetical protein